MYFEDSWAMIGIFIMQRVRFSLLYGSDGVRIFHCILMV
jgi:hypothetical protein